MTVEATPVETPVVESSAPPEKTVSDVVEGEQAADTPAAPADSDSETPDNAEQPEEGARRSRAQERIEELAQTNKYLREHNEFLREHIAKAAKPAATPDPTPAPAAEAAPEEAPTLESCGYDQAKYAKDHAAWVRSEIARGVQAELNKAKTVEQSQSQEQVIVAAANEFRKDHPDFDVLLSNPKLQFTPTVLEALTEAGADSPALGYHLAKNPDKLAKIAKMSPRQQSMQLGKILGEISAKPTPPAPKVPATPTKSPASAPAKKPANTNAPPPPNPVSGAASPEVDPMKLSGVEWAALRRQELAEKRKGQSRTVRSF